MSNKDILEEVEQIESVLELLTRRCCQLKAKLTDVSTSVNPSRGLTPEQRSNLINKRRRTDFNKNNASVRVDQFQNKGTHKSR